ncbi:MAG: ferredoxin:thioredoxin reductase [Methanomicrobiales archaeon]|nr:ferredoxin:thioredoxin reductase [Methanomicrobiales archaeon]
MTETTEEQIRALEEEILAWARDYAKKNGWQLNADEKQLRTVIRGLARNRIRHGERYCPCRIRSGDAEEDKEIICPCVFHNDEVVDEGHCHCNLFFGPGTE